MCTALRICADKQSQKCEAFRTCLSARINLAKNELQNRRLTRKILEKEGGDNGQTKSDAAH